MADSKNRILWEFLLNDKQFQKGSKRTQTSMQKMVGGAKRLAGAVGLAFAGREVLQFGADAITAASDYEESINAVEVSTGRASDEILKLGDTAATQLGLSKTAVNEAAVAFAAFGEKINANDVGGVFEDFIGRATDFASVMNVDVQDALQKFQSGLAGESEPLRRFGIDMSAASVAVFAYANGIAEAGKKLTEAEKVQARYGLLLEQTDKFSGDFIKTQDSLANQQKIANAEMENASILLGKRLIPLQKKWNDVLRQSSKALGTVVEEMGRADKESELMSRTLFEQAKAAGKVTGEWEDLGKSIDGAGESARDMTGFWDVLLGRTRNVEKELADIGSEFERLDFLTRQAAKGVGQFEETIGRVNLTQEQKIGFSDWASDLQRAAGALRDINNFSIPTISIGVPTNLIDNNLLPTVGEGAAIKDAIEFDNRINGT